MPAQGSCSGQDTWCAVDEPDDNFYDTGLANNTMARLRHAAPLWLQHGTPFFVMTGWARTHVPLRVPKRIWDMYDEDALALASHKLPPTDMPGIAWHQQGMFNSSDGSACAHAHSPPSPGASARRSRFVCAAAAPHWLTGRARSRVYAADHKADP